MNMSDWALDYVAQGFKVLPVKLDKTPYTAHGLKDATMLQSTVKEYWARYPDAGIAIATDGLIVVDFDVKNDGLNSLVKIETEKGFFPKTRIHRTGSGGLHYIYRNPNGTNIRNTVNMGGYSGVDIRANGGYIVVPPSSHPSGRCYNIETGGAIADAPEWLMNILKDRKPIQVSGGSDGQVIVEGQRNHTLTSIAGTMRARGMGKEAIEKALLETNQLQCNPPLDETEVLKIASGAAQWQPGELTKENKSKRVSSGRVAQWIGIASGTFTTRQMWSELNITNTDDKNNLRVILSRLCTTGIIMPTGIDGTYRKLDTEKKTINWQDADVSNKLPLSLPFGLSEYCVIYPKSIIIVAGSKNEGKTAFLMSCIMPNVDKFQVDFYNSETGAEQLKQRFEPFNVPYPAPFNTYERYDNFSDIIEPAHLSIIDYLDFNSEVYLVGTEIDKIFRKTTCCAIIGLQKPPPTITYVKGIRKVIDRDLAYGGGFSAKRAVIYISLSSHKLKLVYVKTPSNPKVNPNNMMWSYDIDDNGLFTNIKRYYPYEDDEM